MIFTNKSIYKLFNALFLIVLFNLLAETPTSFLVAKFFGMGCICISFLFARKKLITSHNYFYKTTRKIIALFLLLFFLSVFSSHFFYNQGYLDGISANIQILQVLILMFYAYIFKNEILTLKHIENSILFFILISVVLVLLLFHRVSDTYMALREAGEIGAGSLPKSFIRFGVFYFFALYLKSKKNIHIIIAFFLLLLPNLLVDFQRGYFLVAVFFLTLMFLMHRKTNKVVVTMLVGSGVALFVVLVAASSQAAVFSKISNKLLNLVDVVSSGESNDRSLNVRFIEMQSAMTLFKKSPIIGSGHLQNDITQKVLHVNHYYQSDVGIVGLLGAFGILGLVVYIVLFFKMFGKSIYILRRSSQYSSATIASICYTAALFFEAIQTGGVLTNPALWGFTYLLFSYSKKADDEKRTLEEAGPLLSERLVQEKYFA